ncbi:4-oxalocrotonate tautomerase [Paraburkholderia sp. WC7.3g]|uniref:tautomerase family protein n=1 Tax=Paraburkholderia sp. WC7.3g TaxID=2991070 RepID=UPI003D1D76EA
MPHVVVKLWPGPTEQQKARLAEAIVKSPALTMDASAGAVSVTIEEVTARDWMEKVYRPDIVLKMDKLYKKPGYDPF